MKYLPVSMNSYEHFILIYCAFCAALYVYTKSSISLCEFSKDALLSQTNLKMECLLLTFILEHQDRSISDWFSQFSTHPSRVAFCSNFFTLFVYMKCCVLLYWQDWKEFPIIFSSQGKLQPAEIFHCSIFIKALVKKVSI